MGIKILCKEKDEKKEPPRNALKLKPTDTVLFPNIDSCVAVAIRTGKGDETLWYACHVAQHFDEKTFRNELLKPFNECVQALMQKGLELKKANFVVAFGAKDWSDALNNLCVKFPNVKTARHLVNNGVAGGSDVTIDFKAETIRVVSTATNLEILPKTKLSKLDTKKFVSYGKREFHALARNVRSNINSNPFPTPANIFMPDFDSNEIKKISDRIQEWIRVGGQCIGMAGPTGTDVKKGTLFYHLAFGPIMKVEMEMDVTGKHNQNRVKKMSISEPPKIGTLFKKR